MPRVTAVSLPPALEGAVVAALRERAEVDTVVAGLAPFRAARVVDLDQSDWGGLVAGIREAFFRTQREARGFLERGEPGRVIFLVSTASIRPVQGAGLAAVAGGFLSTIAQVGAVELGGKGITVNVIAHGWVEGHDPEGFTDGIPLGRLARPEEIAAACVFLASEAGSYVNGAVLPVDGGFWITKAGGGSPLVR